MLLLLRERQIAKGKSTVHLLCSNKKKLTALHVKCNWNYLERRRGLNSTQKECQLIVSAHHISRWVREPIGIGSTIGWIETFLLFRTFCVEEYWFLFVIYLHKMFAIRRDVIDMRAKNLTNKNNVEWEVRWEGFVCAPKKEYVWSILSLASN